MNKEDEKIIDEFCDAVFPIILEEMPKIIELHMRLDEKRSKVIRRFRGIEDEKNSNNHTG